MPATPPATQISRLLGIIETGVALIPQVGAAVSVVTGAIGIAKDIAAGSRDVSDEEIDVAEAETRGLVSEFEADIPPASDE